MVGGSRKTRIEGMESLTKKLLVTNSRTATSGSVKSPLKGVCWGGGCGGGGEEKKREKEAE